MALFKLRKGGKEPAAAVAPAETVEAMRRRARHRLIGAAVLVLLGVIGFPLLFDTQPRPIAVDIPIEIPDRNKAKPLAVPAQAPVASGAVTAASPVAAAKPAPAAVVAPATQLAAAEPARAPEKAPAEPEPKPESRPDPKPEARVEPKTEPKTEPKPAGPADNGAKALALLEGKPLNGVAVSGRFIVQVGAFADADKARETRLKVERAGLKTYTQVTDTSEGKRIRVRVGPFANRAEADKAAQKIKGLDLPAAVLSL
jgi:DedD protein